MYNFINYLYYSIINDSKNFYTRLIDNDVFSITPNVTDQSYLTPKQNCSVSITHTRSPLRNNTKGINFLWRLSNRLERAKAF